MMPTNSSGCGQQALVFQAMGAGRQARGLEDGDEARQLPEGEGAGGREALHQLVVGELRRHGHLGQMLRRLVRLDDLHVLENPSLVAQHRIGRIDAPDETVLGVEAEQDDLVELGLGLIHAAGVEDIARRVRGLAQPEPRGAGGHHHRIEAVHILLLHLLVALRRRGRQGIEGAHPENADHKAQQQRGQQHLPDRGAAGTHDDQLAGARQLGEASERRRQQAEGHHFLGGRGQLQDGHEHDEGEGHIGLVGGTAQELDGIAEQGDAAEKHRDAEQPGEETAADVERERGRERRFHAANRGSIDLRRSRNQ